MIPLEPNKTYHLFNRANGNEIIFANDGNYRFFLQKYTEHISGIADTFCYCLMPNHFHFLLRIKEESALTFPKFETLEKLTMAQTLEKLLSKQFSNFFSSYSQAFNKQQGRKGSLFMKNFKRNIVEDQTYLNKLVHYIHYNPVEAGLSASPADWKYSSYNSILSNSKTLLLRNEVIGWFDDLENFKYIHNNSPDLTGID